MLTTALTASASTPVASAWLDTSRKVRTVVPVLLVNIPRQVVLAACAQITVPLAVLQPIAVYARPATA